MSSMLRYALFGTLLAPPLTAQLASVAGPVHQLGAVTAVNKEPFLSIANVRGLPDGSLLVNDQVARRVVLLSPNLELVSVAADSTVLTNSAYGPRAAGLSVFRGDSSLFIDAASLSMMVIDGHGKIARTVAVPRPQDMIYLTGGNQPAPGYDATGHLIYRSRVQAKQGDPKVDPVFPDTAPLLRVDLATRKADTIAYLKIPRSLVGVRRDASGNVTWMNIAINNLLPVVDEWAMFHDGTVAVLRGQDYRLDFISSGGVITHGPKVAYDWERISDERKQELLDSTRAYREKAERERAQRSASTTTVNASGGTSVRTDVIMGGGASGAASVASGAPVSMALPPNIILLPELSSLPDYRPAFGQTGIRADMNNRLWIRTTAVLQSGGGPIYDVIDRDGKRVDRVQIPVGAAITGFGPNDVVYLAKRDSTGIHLQKATVR